MNGPLVTVTRGGHPPAVSHLSGAKGRLPSTTALCNVCIAPFLSLAGGGPMVGIISTWNFFQVPFRRDEIELKN